LACFCAPLRAEQGGGAADPGQARALVLSANYSAVTESTSTALKDLAATVEVPVFVGGRRSGLDREIIERAGAISLGDRFGPAIGKLRRALGRSPDTDDD